MRGLEQAVGCVYCAECCCNKPSCRGQTALHPASSAVVSQQGAVSTAVSTAGRQRKRRQHRRRRARASRRRKRSAQVCLRRQAAEVATKDTDLGGVAVAACQGAADVVVAAVRDDVRRMMQTQPDAGSSRQTASVSAAVATQTGETEGESGAAGESQVEWHECGVCWELAFPKEAIWEAVYGVAQEVEQFYDGSGIFTLVHDQEEELRWYKAMTKRAQDGVRQLERELFPAGGWEPQFAIFRQIRVAVWRSKQEFKRLQSLQV